jgi:hypothetical protein
MLQLNSTHRSFRRYLRSFPDYETLARDLRHQFHFLGDHGVYSFLWTVSEEVPDYEEWAAAHGRPREAKARVTTGGRRPDLSTGTAGDIA